jgi:phage gp29-like protein
MAAVFLQKDNAWREFLNPLRGLSMDRIMQLVEQGERGACADLQWFYQAMERSDALIATVVMRRRAALLSSQWDVQPEREPSDPVLAREQAAFLRDEYDKVGNLRECVAFLSTATFRGYAHAEKHYDGKGGVMRLEPVEQWFWCREGMFGEWTYNREARSGVTAGERVRRGDFVFVEAPMAMNRIMAVQYFQRNMCLKDWVGYLEVYGIPSVFFVGPPGVKAEKEEEYLRIARELMSDGRGYLPNGTDVKYVNGGGAGGRAPFRDHLDYIDRQITLLGTGGLLTMLTEAGSGTLAGSAHSEAFRQVAQADAVLVAEALRRDFDAPLLAAAFPGWPIEAGLEIDVAGGEKPAENGGPQ